MEEIPTGDGTLRTQRTVATIYGDITLTIEADSRAEMRVLHILAKSSLERTLRHLLLPNPEHDAD
ncbi:hypothetical protein [Luteimonas abyssi]|uniref:hypothetical protein n=1 Tax=Luteimonas abyssi TaxID=1247514 RepID=UPI000737CC87|nr:hypothetical protein [Luteimonas abyssi]